MTVHNSWSLDTLIEEYKQHQRRARGLRESTLQGYERFVRLCFEAALVDDPVDPTRLGPTDVIGLVASMRGRYSPHSMKTVLTALRSFLRFLRVKGLCDGRLEAAIPTVAHWKLSTLPRCLSDEQLDQLLASFDDSSPCGLRDRAIVLCLSTLGLRPGEVAALHLEDLDWRRGTIHLRTRKTRQGAVVPLPHHAGRAIVEYLRRERPKTAARHVFVQHLGDRRGLPISSAIVTGAVVRALQRAGIEAPLAGAYVLRHTVACRLARRGTSLKEIADLLGHRSLDTTTIYAKLNVPSLSEVALPWPEVTR
ncbi:MAG: tyrosine-type recombinase/integrase [Tepidiformaceae bacterium]